MMRPRTIPHKSHTPALDATTKRLILRQKSLHSHLRALLSRNRAPILQVETVVCMLGKKTSSSFAECTNKTASLHHKRALFYDKKTLICEWMQPCTCLMMSVLVISQQNCTSEPYSTPSDSPTMRENAAVCMLSDKTLGISGKEPYTRALFHHRRALFLDKRALRCEWRQQCTC